MPACRPRHNASPFPRAAVLVTESVTVVSLLGRSGTEVVTNEHYSAPAAPGDKACFKSG